MTHLDPAYCADGCGRLAETERPTADGRTEAVCAECAKPPTDEQMHEWFPKLFGWIDDELEALGDPSDHATLEDR